MVNNKYIDRTDNIYVLDTRIFGFAHYMSAYLVAGKELALIDTGVPSSYDSVCNAIKDHGFSPKDITYIFVTHCEHPDHSGNAARFLDESPNATVYINAVGEQSLTDPAKADVLRKKWSIYHARWEGMEPVPRSRIHHVSDGDVFDLGNGEILKVIFTPGHQPSGITIFEQKNNGLFINDLIGNYFPDADAHVILTSFGSDIVQSIKSIEKLISLKAANLYSGHYGVISINADQLMKDTLFKMRQVLQIGITCMRQGRPELIGSQLDEFLLPYAEKMRLSCGEKLYQYITVEHLPFLKNAFTTFCRGKLIDYGLI